MRSNKRLRIEQHHLGCEIFQHYVEQEQERQEVEIIEQEEIIEVETIEREEIIEVIYKKVLML